MDIHAFRGFYRFFFCFGGALSRLNASWKDLGAFLARFAPARISQIQMIVGSGMGNALKRMGFVRMHYLMLQAYHKEL